MESTDTSVAGSSATQTYEEKKAERARKREEMRKIQRAGNNAGRIKRFLVTVVVLGLITFGIVSLIRANSPQGPDHSRSYPIQSRDHIAIGADHPPYNSNPPTGGWHYETPAYTGFYEEPLPDEQLVHNLEHGEIWIAYRPSVSQDIREELRKFTDDPKIIVTPREANETDLALVAWGRLDTFNADEFSAERVRGFIVRYKNRGPENVPPMRR